MFSNYLKIATRFLWRNKGYALVNIVGLGLGISCCMLIALYIFDELSYENFHTNKDRIYRVTADLNLNGETTTGLTSLAVAPTLKSDYPQIKEAVRMLPMGNRITVTYGDQIFRQENLFMTDSGFFDVFTYELIRGNPATALIAPRSLILTQSTARKIFGEEDPMDKQILLNKKEYNITGIISDPPSNTDLLFEGLASMSSFPKELSETFNWDWFRICTFTYVLFEQEQHPVDFDTALVSFAAKYVQPFAEENGVKDAGIVYGLQPLEAVHLDNSKQFDSPKGNMAYLYIFGLVALFILVIACINYINLSLAQSSKRAKEVGIRKTVGADRKNLIRQFLGESMIVATIALVMALMLVELLLPTFNSLAGKQFEFTSILRFDIVLFLLGIIVFIGLISGSYPAMVLSSLQPIHVLGGSMPKIGSIGFLRKILVVVQFVFSIAMILGTLIVFNQMDYMQNRNLGFNQDQVMVIEMPADTLITRKMAHIKDELMKIPNIKDATFSKNIQGNTMGEVMFRVELDGQLTERGLKFMQADESFIDLMEIELVAGRNFMADSKTDLTEAFLVNETAARTFGWENPVGKRMQWGLKANNQAAYDGKVVGVFKDFHFASLHNPIEPMAIGFSKHGFGYLSLKVEAENLDATIATVETGWRQFDGENPFEFFFLDDHFNKLYQSENKMLRIFGYFSILSILIACMGLFALTSFTTKQRTKEIGIRKVMGASIKDITLLISKDFLKLVAIAFMLACPVAWYFIDQWLAGFSYRVDMSIISFLWVGLLAFLIALLAISYHAITAARANPVNSLKYE